MCTREFTVCHVPPEPCSEGRRRWCEDVQEERQSEPGAWAPESQRLLSAKAGGRLVGTGLPQPFPGVLEPRGALSGKKMPPRTATPVASAHVPPTTFSAGSPSSGRKCSLALSSPEHGDPAPQFRPRTLLPSGYSRFPVERLLCDPEIHSHPRTCALIWKRSLQI